MTLEELKNPIGKFQKPETISEEQLEQWLTDLENLPKELAEVIGDITKEQLDFTYRQGSWTIRQIVHHLADSHLHAYLRMKWVLTEDNCIIKPYDENKMISLADYKEGIASSVNLLTIIHHKWSVVLDSLEEKDFNRFYTHPEYKTTVTLAEQTALYVWHGKNHLAQIKNALKFEGNPPL